MVLHHLKDSSKDETGVQWRWWDQHNRKALWYWALTRQDVSIQEPVLMIICSIKPRRALALRIYLFCGFIASTGRGMSAW